MHREPVLRNTCKVRAMYDNGSHQRERIRVVVCHCNAICESEMRAAARRSDGTIADAYAQLGCAVECGGCLPFAEELIDEETRELLAA